MAAGCSLKRSRCWVKHRAWCYCLPVSNLSPSSFAGSVPANKVGSSDDHDEHCVGVVCCTGQQSGTVATGRLGLRLEISTLSSPTCMYQSKCLHSQPIKSYKNHHNQEEETDYGESYLAA